MDEPIFQTKYLASKVRVYEDRVEWRMLLKRDVIPLNQIASVEVSMPMYTKVTIETTGGKRFDIPVPMSKKKALQEAIVKAQQNLKKS